MSMKIKTKLYAGLGFLALLIIILWSSGLVFINMLADNSRAIIRNNIRTVTYMEDMQKSLKSLHVKQVNGLHLDQAAANSLEQHLLETLSKQQQNITEEGEAELSHALQQALMRYLSLSATQIAGDYQQLTQQYAAVQQLMGQITYKNLDAIQRKNNSAQRTASMVILYMTIIGAISTIFAIGLLVKYPSYIVNPIKELIRRIKEIANQNYDQKLEFKTGDEYEELAIAFNTMAKRLKEYDSSNIAKLMNEKQRIETIINHMSEAVIGLDKDKNILFVNDKAGELLGRDPDRLIGSYAPDIASTNDLMRNLIHDLMHTPDTNQNQGRPDLIKIAAANEQVYYSKELLPVHSIDGPRTGEQRIGTIITLKNVTRFQELDEAKTNFVAIVSHELKTPIASINMSLRLLDDERVGMLNKEQHELLQSIRNESTRMKNTISELLDLSRIETGNIHLNMQSARPIDLLEYAYETMLMQAHKQNVTMIVDCDESLPEVKTDTQKTVWVLVNLISNALRYTPQQGEIMLAAKNDTTKIIFSVKDNGKGIPSEYQDKIFDKYFQVHGDQNGEGGSGLGLAIAREFIMAQGGEINVESELGEGSRFYFTLPKQ